MTAGVVGWARSMWVQMPEAKQATLSGTLTQLLQRDARGLATAHCRVWRTSRTKVLRATSIIMTC